MILLSCTIRPGERFSGVVQDSRNVVFHVEHSGLGRQLVPVKMVSRPVDFVAAALCKRPCRMVEPCGLDYEGHVGSSLIVVRRSDKCFHRTELRPGVLPSLHVDSFFIGTEGSLERTIESRRPRHVCDERSVVKLLGGVSDEADGFADSPGAVSVPPRPRRSLRHSGR